MVKCVALSTLRTAYDLCIDRFGNKKNPKVSKILKGNTIEYLQLDLTTYDIVAASVFSR